MTSAIVVGSMFSSSVTGMAIQQVIADSCDPHLALSFAGIVPVITRLHAVCQALTSRISSVTDAVIEQVVEWQSRPLDVIYPSGCLDYVVVKVRQDKKVTSKAF